MKIQRISGERSEYPIAIRVSKLLIEKISNFYNFVIFDQRSMKLGTHVLPEVLNQITSSLLAQPTKKASYRDFSKNS